MTRRLATVIVGAVVATLLIVGAGTLLLANVRARYTTERDLRKQATALSKSMDQLLDIPAPDTVEGRAQVRRRLRLLKGLTNALPVGDVAVLTSDAAGNLSGEGLPPGVTLADLDPTALARSNVVSGSNGNTVYAAAPAKLPNGRAVVVVLSRAANAGLGASVRFFLLTSIATLMVGLLIAVLVGRRLTRPIREASAATTRIAAGELSTRLPDPAPGDHDELAELSRSINGMAAGLQRSRVLEQQFLLSVSHDLRTPLTSIRGYAEAITDGAAEPQAAADVILSESRRLERLVADLLDLAKLQTQGFSLRPVALDLAAAATTAVSGFAPDAADRRVDVRVATATATMVVADRDRLAQVIANVIENSLKYARFEVLVSVTPEYRGGLLTVDDDGPGIAEEDLPHVFERLYVARLEPQRKESSSGLGLAIVKELVEAMGGSVGAGVAPSGGARIWLVLPAALEAPRP